jgi:hypothetical protein
MNGMTRDEMRAEWRRRLRRRGKNKIKQARRTLGYASGSRCCLGVLCDVAGLEPRPLGSGVLVFGHESEATTTGLPPSLWTFVGLRSGTGADATDCRPLSYLNDEEGLSFIAIEKLLAAGDYWAEGDDA